MVMFSKGTGRAESEVGQEFTNTLTEISIEANGIMTKNKERET